MDKLVNELYAEGQLFCKQLEKVRSLSCVEGHFGAFIGSNVIQKALKKAEASKIEKELIIDSLRNSINSLYENSASWKHSLEKPFGYPGDYAILELIYDNIPHPNTMSARGRLIDLWGQSSILPRAVNARKNALRVFIEKFSEKYSEENKARILSIASGSAREIRDLTFSSLTNLDVTLLDQDKRALDFVTGFFQSRPKSKPPPPPPPLLQAGRKEKMQRERKRKADIRYVFFIVRYLNILKDWSEFQSQFYTGRFLKFQYILLLILTTYYFLYQHPAY